jgi:hypothetical protein
MTNNNISLLAIESVDSLFASSDTLSLSRINLALAEYDKKLFTLQAQLKNSIGSCIEETRLSLELLSNNTTCIDEIRNNFSLIHDYCLESKSLLTHYPEIERVNIARRNIESTLRLLDKFKSIRGQTDELLDLLDENDRAIKHVYKGLKKLFKLKDSALSAQEIDNNSNLFVTDEMKEDFEALESAAEALEKRMWENIADCEILAHDDPATLIRTLEIIEIEDRSKRKIFDVYKQLNVSNSSNNNDMNSSDKILSPTSINRANVSPLSLSMHERCLSVLEQSIADLFQPLCADELDSKKRAKRAENKKRQFEEKNRKLAAAANDSASESEESYNSNVSEVKVPSDYVCKILEELRELVENFPTLLALLTPCFPPEYNINAFYTARYAHWIKVVLHFHVNAMEKLSKRALLSCVQFIQTYIERLQATNQYDNSSKLEFERIINELMKSFCEATELTMKSLVDNIIVNDFEENTGEANDDGYLITSAPADLFFTINAQIDLVTNQLQALALAHVCNMIIHIFQYYQRKVLQLIGQIELEGEDCLLFGPKKIKKSEEYFAALINNSLQCESNTDELKEKCLTEIDEEARIFKVNNPALVNNPIDSIKRRLDESFEDCASGFVSVASEAIDILVLIILTTLQPIMTQLFTAKWLKSDQTIQTCISTIIDFLSDYSQWIQSKAYFVQIIKKALQAFNNEYIRKFIETKLTISNDLIHRLEEDTQALTAFIYDNYLSNADYSSLLTPQAVDNEMAPLKQIIQLLQYSTEQMSDLELFQVHFSTIKQAFKQQPIPLFEAALNCRTDINKPIKKQLLELFTNFIKRNNDNNNNTNKIIQPTPSMSSRLTSIVNSTSSAAPVSFWARLKLHQKSQGSKGNNLHSTNNAASLGNNTSNAKKSSASGPEETLRLDDFLSD